MLFSSRFGFSGTPSDLLPVEFGRCQFEKGDDARMLRVLTDDAVVSHQLLPFDWDAAAVLRLVANMEPPLHALIDSGALVRSLSAVYWIAAHAQHYKCTSALAPCGQYVERVCRTPTRTLILLLAPTLRSRRGQAFECTAP